MRLEHLADLELSYSTEFLLVQPYGGEEGSGYGEGEGRIEGATIHGSVRWVNHPHRRSDTAMLPNTDGFIRTDDDALLLFHLDGRTIWSEDGSRGGQSLRVLFESEDDRFRWLNDALCVLEGVVDPERLVMVAKIYVCRNELLEDGPAAG